MSLEDIKNQVKSMLGREGYRRIVADLNLKENSAHCQCPSPTHEDNNPSASWSDDLNSIYCHACGINYDIISHVQEKECSTYPEAVIQLATELNLDTSGVDVKSFVDYKKKRYAEATQEYAKKLSNLNYQNPVTDYFERNKVNQELLRNVYGITTSDNEIFFNHLEKDFNGNWASCYTKRRKLDGSFYELSNNKGGFNEAKEITIAGGNVCFYGQASLFNSDGKPKKYGIIVEGQTDCHRTATEMHLQGQFEQFAILSVPTGSKTLKTAWNESPTFRKWYQKNCESLYIIPDADKAGLEMIDIAKDLFNGDEKVRWCDLTQLGGIKYKDKKGQDITDAFNLRHGFKEIFTTADYLPMEQCYNPKAIEIEKVQSFLWSGFATHDFNDTGLKAGKVTIITGKRGSGKTTLVGQMCVAVTEQSEKVFCFFGETPMSETIETFAHMTSDGGLIDEMDNGAGRRIFTPNEEAIEIFKRTYSNKILFYEDDQQSTVNKYDLMKAKMLQAVKRGYKLFVIDNLMILTIKRQAVKFFNKFDEQTRISDDLKQFAKDNGVSVIILAHPNAGGEKVSGAMEVENLADTILHYRRLDEESAKAMASCYNVPAHEAEKISAVVTSEKVRNHGTSHPMFLEWIGKRGIVQDITYLDDAQKTADRYNQKNWFSRSMKKYDKEDSNF